MIKEKMLMRTMYLLISAIVKYFVAFSGWQKTKYLFKLNRTSKYWLQVVAMATIVDGKGKNSHECLPVDHTEPFAITSIKITTES